MSSSTERKLIAQYVEQIHERFVESMQRPDCVVEERRSGRREVFTRTRLIAAWDGESRLQEADFMPILCRDLSADGIAFWTEQRPSVPYYVVKFEMNGEVVFLKARVVHATPDFTDGRPPFVVGCEFVGRLDVSKRP